MRKVIIKINIILEIIVINEIIIKIITMTIIDHQENIKKQKIVNMIQKILILHFLQNQINIPLLKKMMIIVQIINIIMIMINIEEVEVEVVQGIVIILVIIVIIKIVIEIVIEVLIIEDNFKYSYLTNNNN